MKDKKSKVAVIENPDIKPEPLNIYGSMEFPLFIPPKPIFENPGGMNKWTVFFDNPKLNRGTIYKDIGGFSVMEPQVIVEVVDKAAYDQIKRERDRYEKLAESWMADYDRLKAKYEPDKLI